MGKKEGRCLVALGSALTGFQAVCRKLSGVQAHLAASPGALGALGNITWLEGQVADAHRGAGTTLMDSKHETFHLHTAAYLTSMWCNFMEVLPRGGRAAPAHIHHMSQSPSASCHHTERAGKRRTVELCGPTSVQLLWGSALVQSAIK